MIPQKIHYCWFGRNRKPLLVERCIETWKEHLPSFDIIEWNEDNSEIDSSFAQQALSRKKWAFVSDYVRLKVLYQYGGLYLDTDMYFVKPIGKLMHLNCFLGKQNWQIAAGIIGAEPGNIFIKKCVEKYEKLKYDESRMLSMAIPLVVTEAYNKLKEQQVELPVLFEAGVFYPYTITDSLQGKNFYDFVKPETIAVHLWNASWFSKKEFAGLAFERKEFLKGVGLLIQFLLERPSFLVQMPSLLIRHCKRMINSKRT